MLLKPRRIKDAKYRKWIATKPCIFCFLLGYGETLGSDCCHAYTGGMGTKCSDRRTFPACNRHHKNYDAGRDKFLSQFKGFDLDEYMNELNEEYAIERVT